jgi:hypothetical protein
MLPEIAEDFGRAPREFSDRKPLERAALLKDDECLHELVFFAGA